MINYDSINNTTHQGRDYVSTYTYIVLLFVWIDIILDYVYIVIYIINGKM